MADFWYLPRVFHLALTNYLVCWILSKEEGESRGDLDLDWRFAGHI